MHRVVYFGHLFINRHAGRRSALYPNGQALVPFEKKTLQSVADLAIASKLPRIIKNIFECVGLQMMALAARKMFDLAEIVLGLDGDES